MNSESPNSPGPCSWILDQVQDDGEETRKRYPNSPWRRAGARLNVDTVWPLPFKGREMPRGHQLPENAPKCDRRTGIPSLRNEEPDPCRHRFERAGVRVCLPSVPARDEETACVSP